MRKHKTFIPEKYGMIFCPHCNSLGKIYGDDSESQVCTLCGGFGAIKKPEGKIIRAREVIASIRWREGEGERGHSH